MSSNKILFDEEIKRIKSLQANSNETIKLVKVNGSSEVWKRFKRISENDKATDYVQCSECSKI